MAKYRLHIERVGFVGPTYRFRDDAQGYAEAHYFGGANTELEKVSPSDAGELPCWLVVDPAADELRADDVTIVLIEGDES